MILVLASVVDHAASAFAKELASVTAASLLTCRDLAEEPTTFRYPDFAASWLTIDGRKTGMGEIGGVIHLLPQVLPEELFFYPPEEREYQAAEFHALLTFFLSALVCPVVSRPTPQALSGPCASSIAWRYFAKRCGIAVSSMKLDTDDVDGFFGHQRAEPTFEVSCLGRRLITPSGTAADRITMELSERADVAYLRAVFEDRGADPRFVTASAVPDLKNSATRRALIHFFERIPRCA
jgi:hypothetical protein